MRSGGRRRIFVRLRPPGSSTCPYGQVMPLAFTVPQLTVADPHLFELAVTLAGCGMPTMFAVKVPAGFPTGLSVPSDRTVPSARTISEAVKTAVGSVEVAVMVILPR